MNSLELVGVALLVALLTRWIAIIMPPTWESETIVTLLFGGGYLLLLGLKVI